MLRLLLLNDLFSRCTDNEYSQSPDFHASYFVELENVYHNSAIDVPLTYNDPGMGSSFINGTVSHIDLIIYL